MDFTHTGRAEEGHVFPVSPKLHGGQLVNLALINRGLEREIIQGLFDRNVGGFRGLRPSSHGSIVLPVTSGTIEAIPAGYNTSSSQNTSYIKCSHYENQYSTGIGNEDTN